ncbi:hypothetical protein ALC56_11279 [Trachymyrmex septentrionalis]|uniref:Uncharacterized protein n=1 Tax=Trachymyrmex septentrionalis TaxID=34720 RepID=A0A195F131_9HYME|nr:hypothetical protein ALC56_11279 [Trachymyrmex septentrionalis]
MQLSALVRGVSRSTRAIPAGRVGGGASVPDRISHPIAVQSLPNLVFMVQNSPESDNNNKRRSPSTSPYVKVPRSDMATSIRLRATHCRGDT